jgi:predicted MPP superfamily phosphohydrolase
MRRFWIAILAVTLVGHALFAGGLAFGLGRLGVPAAGWVAVAVAALPVLVLRGRLRRGLADRPVPAWRVWLIEEPYFAHWGATLVAWPLFLVAVIPATLLGAGAGAAALGAYALALALCLYGVLVRRRWVRVRRIDVPIAGMADAFDGYRIAQLSDLHIGGLWPRARAARWVARVNALDVDLVALTGDYVTHGDAFHEDIAAVLAEMRGRDGAVAVMGNHDYFGDGEKLVALLRRRGVRVLRNERHEVRRGGEAITLVGVDDTWTRRADVAGSLEGYEGEGPLVALAHDPRLFPELARRGAALVLSGHTHWGQIALPFLATRINLSRLSYRYHAGLYREGGAVLYVSPGLGTTGPPLRLGAPPEITVVTLRAANSATPFGHAKRVVDF